jgi:hypothetical protein
VFIGLDHSHFDRSKILVYETLVMAPGRSIDLTMIRYSTRKQARKGHRMVVEVTRRFLAQIQSYGRA